MSTLGILIAGLVLSGPAPEIDFNRDVRPILSENCFGCHGPDGAARKAWLRLDTPEGAQAKLRSGRRAVVPGGPSESALIERVESFGRGHMPPASSNKHLKAEQVRLLRRWVEQGAKWSAHWAFVPPRRPPLPTVSRADWPRNGIDHFIIAGLDRAGLIPSPEAERTRLIRRVTLDLTGLPPTPAEVDAFLADRSPGAYEKVVDRLLDSPHCAERLALEWLDVARYADTHGYNIDPGRHMTPWRDWVIDAFRRNLPFDRFTVEQLAGDLLPGATAAQKIATGFNRNHMTNVESGALDEEFRTAYVVDRVNTTAAAWLSLTVACAQCHDHKFDPISQKEYYQLFAFFQNVAEKGIEGDHGNADPVLRLPMSPGQHYRAEQWRARLAALRARRRDEEDDNRALRQVQRAVPIEAVAWQGLRPVAAFALSGARARALSDGSVAVAGEVPAEDTIVVTAEVPFAHPTALRVESLPVEPPHGGRNLTVLLGLALLWPMSLRIGRRGRWTRRHIALICLAVSAGTVAVFWASLADDVWVVAKLYHLSDRRAGDDEALSIKFVSLYAADREPPEDPLDEFLYLRPGGETAGASGDGVARLQVSRKVLPGAPARLRVVLQALYPAAGQRLRRFRLRATCDDNLLDPSTAFRDKQVAAAEDALDRIEREATCMVMEEMAEPREAFVLVRGAYDRRGERVEADVPAVLPPLPADAPHTRLGLARWLVDPGHPLTARVAVNRYWQMLFGTGLVATPEDFGTQGQPPSHPELLDWLAVEFVRPSPAPLGTGVAHGWDVKALLRLLVTSATYRQGSARAPATSDRDPHNRLLGRFPRVRLQAEFIRDQALAVSGLLNRTVGGESVYPYQPAGLWEELAQRSDSYKWSAQTYVQSHGPDLYRRSLYTFWKRAAPPPNLLAFDAPPREVCCLRRAQTNTPLQALVLLNDPTFVEASRKLAERLLTEAATPSRRVELGFRSCTARLPAAEETDELLRLYREQQRAFAADAQAARRLLTVGESPRREGLDDDELAAWTVVVGVLLNLDETITKD
jgi:hypothetical protein